MKRRKEKPKCKDWEDREGWKKTRVEVYTPGKRQNGLGALLAFLVPRHTSRVDGAGSLINSFVSSRAPRGAETKCISLDAVRECYDNCSRLNTSWGSITLFPRTATLPATFQIIIIIIIAIVIIVEIIIYIYYLLPGSLLACWCIYLRLFVPTESLELPVNIIFICHPQPNNIAITLSSFGDVVENTIYIRVHLNQWPSLNSKIANKIGQTTKNL